MVDTFNRLEGARATYGIKKPVRAASTGNLTLSGFQTIDGVAISSGDESAGYNVRVLVKDQTASEQNGIYYVTSSAWARTKDFDGNTDLVKGTIAEVQSGTVNGGRLYCVDSADPPSVGVNALTFKRYNLDDFTKNGTIASASTIDLDTADGGAEDGDFITVTGTTTINTITLTAGRVRVLLFEDSLSLNSGSYNRLPGGGINNSQTITTRAGDIAVVRSVSESGNTYVRVVSYFRKDGHPLIAEEYSIASAASMTIDSSGSSPVYAQCLKVTGTTQINTFGAGSNTPIGALKILRFEGALTVAGITSLGAGLPDGETISIAANDILALRRDSDQTWRVIWHFRADMHPSIVDQANVASGATTDLGTSRAQCQAVTGTTTITSFGSSAPTGAVKFLSFSSALSITYNATSMILPGGASLHMLAGDRLVARHEGSGNWRVLVVERTEPAVDVTASDASNSTTGEETLHSYNLPASRLFSSGDSFHVRAWGVTAATTIAKQVRLRFGGQVVADTGSLALNGASWELSALITRTSSSAQRAVGQAITDSTLLQASVLISTPAAVLAATAGSTLTLTAEATSTSAVTAKGLAVQILAR